MTTKEAAIPLIRDTPDTFLASKEGSSVGITKTRVEVSQMSNPFSRACLQREHWLAWRFDPYTIREDYSANTSRLRMGQVP